ncbi:MAG: apolipoprotein N-acyltransferase [Acidimicrobiia bacterium]|nr:apolipoprotein N-acyltransferase [Acidimicrobiia bacterium]
MAGLVCGLLLWVSHPPVDWGAAGFVALVPLLLVSRTPARGASAGAAAGAVFFGMLLAWVFPFAWFGWVALVATLMLEFVIVGWVAGIVYQRLGPAWWLLAVPASLTVAEWVRGHWPLGGFAWGELGATQHGITATRYVVAIGGVALLTWVVALVNSALAVAVDSVLTHGSWRDRVVPVVGALVVAVGVCTAAYAFHPRAAPVGVLDIGLVQANRFEDGEVTPEEMSDEHIRVTRTLGDGLDLVVWGESSIWEQPVTPQLTQDIADSAGGASVLANAYVVGAGDDTYENTNVLIGADGDVRDEYVKRHVVPFGERVPWRSALGFVRQLDQVPRDAVPGDEVGTFEVDGHTVGSVICFESAFPDPVRDTVRAGAEGIFVLTNNASFGRSSLSEQYLALTRLRAVETHRSEVVAAVSGRSALIDADGTLRTVTGLFDTETVEWTMPLHDDKTLYVRWGDWFVWVAGAALIGTGFALWGRGRGTSPGPSRGAGATVRADEATRIES